MKGLFAAVVLLSILAVTCGEVVNSTDCNIVNTNCNGGGVCQDDGLCRCFVGFASRNRTRNGVDCSLANTDKATQAIRIFVGASYGFLLLLILYRVLLEFIIDAEESQVEKWTTRWNLGLITVYCIWMTALSADYGGAYGLVNPRAYYALYSFRDNFHVFIFLSMLSHWADMYHCSMKKIKRVEMLKRIKPDYTEEATLDGVMSELKGVSKYRIAYIAMCALSILVFAGRMASYNYSRVAVHQTAFEIFYSAFYMFIWLLFSFGYVYYGVRLLRILPESITEMIISVIALTGIFAVFAIATSAINVEFTITLQSSSFAVSRAKLLASYVLSWSMGFCSVNVYMPIWQWHRWMNPKVIYNIFKKSGKSKSVTEKAETPMATEVVIDAKPPDTTEEAEMTKTDLCP